MIVDSQQYQIKRTTPSREKEGENVFSNKTRWKKSKYLWDHIVQGNTLPIINIDLQKKDTYFTPINKDIQISSVKLFGELFYQVLFLVFLINTNYSWIQIPLYLGTR